MPAAGIYMFALDDALVLLTFASTPYDNRTAAALAAGNRLFWPKNKSETYSSWMVCTTCTAAKLNVILSKALSTPGKRKLCK